MFTKISNLIEGKLAGPLEKLSNQHIYGLSVMEL